MAQVIPDETLLGLIAARASHGYEMLEYFRDPDALGRVWNLSTSQLYAVLKRLEEQGYTVGQSVASEDGPPRTRYSLTEQGSAQLREWLEEDSPAATVRRVRVEFLSRLYICRLLKQPTAPIIQRQRQTCQKRLSDLTVQRQNADHGIGRLALELEIAQLETILKWLDNCE
ncbi:MAG: PadR family transcriptional regulator [Anaerolineae bacterium]|nr:PadR family transcriptional regulator [Anaerolineae bacterium]